MTKHKDYFGTIHLLTGCLLVIISFFLLEWKVFALWTWITGFTLFRGTLKAQAILLEKSIIILPLMSIACVVVLIINKGMNKSFWIPQLLCGFLIIVFTIFYTLRFGMLSGQIVSIIGGIIICVGSLLIKIK